MDAGCRVLRVRFRRGRIELDERAVVAVGLAGMAPKNCEVLILLDQPGPELKGPPCF